MDNDLYDLLSLSFDLFSAESAILLKPYIRYTDDEVLAIMCLLILQTLYTLYKPVVHSLSRGENKGIFYIPKVEILKCCDNTHTSGTYGQLFMCAPRGGQKQLEIKGDFLG